MHDGDEPVVIERWVTIAEVADHLGLPVSGARRLLRVWGVPRQRWGHRIVRYRLSEVDEILGGATIDE